MVAEGAQTVLGEGLQLLHFVASFFNTQKH
jgi:hypothetical protein